MKPFTENILSQGYIMIPKVLLREMTTKKACGELEAFLQILLHVNYSDTIYTVRGNNINCQRGESIISHLHWAQILGWSRSKATRFLHKLCQKEIIEIIPNEQNILHIRVVNYEEWTGHVNTLSIGSSQESSTDFDHFWDQYHEIMRLPKRNVGRARNEWLKLARKEQKLAISHIEEFYYHITDTRFIPLASTYLKDKAFLDEYLD